MVEAAGAPVSKPRTASIIGVSGWCWATPCSHGGSVSTGTNPLLMYGRNTAKKVYPLAASGELANSPTAAENHEIARMNRDSRQKASEPLDRTRRRAEPDKDRDPDHERRGDEVPDQARSDVPSQEGPGHDRHRAQPIDHAVLEVRTHAHRRRRGTERRREQDDRRQDVVDIGRPGVDRPAEQEDEHEHEQHRQRQARDQPVDVSEREAVVPAQHDPRLEQHVRHGR